MPKQIKNIEERLLYTLVWAVVFLIPILNFFMLPNDKLYLVELMLAWLKILPFFTIFIIHTAILLPLFALRRKYIIYISLLLGVILTIFGLVELFDYASMKEKLYIVDLNGNKVTGSLLFTYINFLWNSLLSIAMCSACYAIKLVYVSVRNEKTMAELKRRTVEAEMEQLKHQINPHFIMNTLNNIHALIDIDTEQSKSAIIELSKMFRHLVYESDGRHIKLCDDLKFVENYINLMKLRYTDSLTIKFDYPDSLSESIYVPPLVLVLFVENAFKHGVRGNTSSRIEINIAVTDKRVIYCVDNSVSSRKSTKHGIGLENLVKRLDLIFDDDYKLTINSLEGRYSVKLDIPISYEN